VKSSYRSGAILFALVAAAACSSEPDGNGSDGSGPTVPGFPGAGAVPGGASNPNTPAPTGAPSTNNEATQVNQLVPAQMTGNGPGNPPAQPGNTQAPATTPPATTPPTTDPNAMQPMPPATPPPTTGGASAGCGVSQGMPANPTTIADPNTIVTFPQGYDGSTPFPIVFAFHGANRTNVQMRMEDSRTPGSQLENNYVMAFVKSQGTAWDLATDYPRVKALITQVLAERCIDTGHIFAIGHSSGAQFIAGMLGDSRARETRFAAVVPVSSNNLNNPNWTPLPTMLIHGLMDTQRQNDLNGAQDITQYTKSNQCTGGTQPVNIGTCSSIANGATVNPGCVSYNGCAKPTLFCNHNDPNYLENGTTPTNHGWPCFANNQIFSFFEATR
jgi:polyhydroxybutyrate depolymerase